MDVETAPKVLSFPNTLWATFDVEEQHTKATKEQGQTERFWEYSDKSIISY